MIKPNESFVGHIQFFLHDCTVLKEHYILQEILVQLDTYFQRYRVSKKNCNSANELSLLQNQVKVLNLLNLVKMPYLLVTLCVLLRDPIYVFIHEASKVDE